MLIVYGMVDNSSIGQLYAGAFLPGFLLAGLYILYITIRCYINPMMGPPVPKEERLDWNGLFKVALPIIPASMLIFLVLGTIIIGIAAPTEAAGVGCLGAWIIAMIKGRMSWKDLVQAAENTIKATGMVMWTMFGANIFIALYIMVGGGDFVSNMLLGSGLGEMDGHLDHDGHPDLPGLLHRLGRDPHAHRPPLRADHPASSGSTRSGSASSSP